MTIQENKEKVADPHRSEVYLWDIQTGLRVHVCGIVSHTYLHEAAWGQVHFDDKHDWDPDDRTHHHQPPHHHGPGRVGVVLIGHHLPLVQTQPQDTLQGERRNGRREED